MTDTKLALVGNLQKTLDAEKTAVATGIRGGMEALQPEDVADQQLRVQARGVDALVCEPGRGPLDHRHHGLARH